MAQNNDGVRKHEIVTGDEVVDHILANMGFTWMENVFGSLLSLYKFSFRMNLPVSRRGINEFANGIMSDIGI